MQSRQGFESLYEMKIVCKEEQWGYFTRLAAQLISMGMEANTEVT